MTVSTFTPDKDPSIKQINFAEPLVNSVRLYLANEIPSKELVYAQPQASPLDCPDTCDIDIHTDPQSEVKNIICFESNSKRNDLNNNSNRHIKQKQTNQESITTQIDQSKMPSKAELMQRQPLLSRNGKQDTQITSDSSDPDHEDAHASPPLNGDFVIEINPPNPREERYPKEILKCLFSFIFLFLCVCVNMASLALVHERLPDRKTTPPLNDIFLENIDARDWGLEGSEVLIILSSTTAVLVVVFHKHRFIVARRLFFLVGLLYLYRALTMFVTVLPVASKTYYCSPKANSTDVGLIVNRVFFLISGFGLSINGKHTYCGDFIYSGHTMILVLSYLVTAEYTPKKLWPMHWCIWIMGVVGVFFVLLAHGHYTVDVVIAYYITTRLFWTYHTLLTLPMRTGPSAHMIQREWWYFMFCYLEKNARGPVPRRYDWPLPWPRTKLFSRLS